MQVVKLCEIPHNSLWYEKSKNLRQDILRTPIGLLLSDKDTAGEDQQIHIAAIDNDKVVGCILLKPLPGGRIKFRQVAIAGRLQGQGFGRKLMTFAEECAKARQFTSAEMSARISAQVFYEKLGYTATGEPFSEVGLATIKMEKIL